MVVEEFGLNSESSMMADVVVVAEGHEDGGDDDKLMDYELSYFVAYDEIVVVAVVVEHDKVVEVFDEYYLDLPNLSTY